MGRKFSVAAMEAAMGRRPETELWELRVVRGSREQ